MLHTSTHIHIRIQLVQCIKMVLGLTTLASAFWSWLPVSRPKQPVCYLHPYKVIYRSDLQLYNIMYC